MRGEMNTPPQMHKVIAAQIPTRLSAKVLK